MEEKFKEEVIRALEKDGIKDTYYAGKARSRRCARHDVRMEKFRGLKTRPGRSPLEIVAYACRNCRQILVWPLANPKLVKVDF